MQVKEVEHMIKHVVVTDGDIIPMNRGKIIINRMVRTGIECTMHYNSRTQTENILNCKNLSDYLSEYDPRGIRYIVTYLPSQGA